MRRVEERWGSGLPFDVPAVAQVEGLELDAPVTLPAGDNGTGKSRLIEAIAEAMGYGAEGGELERSDELPAVPRAVMGGAVEPDARSRRSAALWIAALSSACCFSATGTICRSMDRLRLSTWIRRSPVMTRGGRARRAGRLRARPRRDGCPAGEPIAANPHGSHPGAVRKTTITIDDGRLEAVQVALGTSGITQTVDRALREVLAAEARRREVERLTTMRGIDLDDPEVMARAWRG
ncbi:MAG TPA: hypothetical protein VGW11_06845 [Solirubrobacteraceae bacterium]|nr:hypothetical protein [Solirubrobacteraceae bacterium]